MSFSVLILGLVIQSEPVATGDFRDLSLSTEISILDESRINTAGQRWDFSRSRVETGPLGATHRFLRSLESRDAIDAQSLGLAITVSPDGPTPHEFTGWRFVAGFDNERLEFSPGASTTALLYRGGSISVADGYAGLATEFDHGGFVTWGYVRQERTAITGERTWSEDSHFVGMAYQLTW
ncbi:MAG: hypothetical protein DHS20C06_07930 [Hyphobacterium sp.]|nr:MAG: hypothetical protein DHS20C06_07930 [Hyphobacterium sp.]